MMVRDDLQLTVRRQLADKQATLPYDDRKRETAEPTAEVVWELFSDRVLLVLTTPGGGAVRQRQGLAEAQPRVLDMIGLEKEALTERKNERSERMIVGM